MCPDENVRQHLQLLLAPGCATTTAAARQQGQIPMKLIDSIVAPGSKLGGGLKSGAGDDRYAFDEAAGWAAVIDGATDVGPVRLYPDAESDAARYAELLAAAMMAAPAVAGETPADYFRRLLTHVADAASLEARVPLRDAPLSSYPTAAATWTRLREGRIEAATLGDTIAILRTPEGAVTVFGEPEKPGDEQARARTIMQRTEAERLKWLQDTRAVHNTSGGYWVFGVQPEAADHIVHQTGEAPAGSHLLMMTDGFYRLVSPYGRYSDAQLIGAAIARGLPALMSELRSMESRPEDDAALGRFKTSDDATALLFEV